MFLRIQFDYIGKISSFTRCPVGNLIVALEQPKHFNCDPIVACCYLHHRVISFVFYPDRIDLYTFRSMLLWYAISCLYRVWKIPRAAHNIDPLVSGLNGFYLFSFLYKGVITRSGECHSFQGSILFQNFQVDRSTTHLPNDFVVRSFLRGLYSRLISFPILQPPTKPLALEHWFSSQSMSTVYTLNHF
jgi:hypothetical protein